MVNFLPVFIIMWSRSLISPSQSVDISGGCVWNTIYMHHLSRHTDYKCPPKYVWEEPPHCWCGGQSFPIKPIAPKGEGGLSTILMQFSKFFQILQKLSDMFNFYRIYCYVSKHIWVELGMQ